MHSPVPVIGRRRSRGTIRDEYLRRAIDIGERLQRSGVDRERNRKLEGQRGSGGYNLSPELD